jgi:hypothetical protein
MPDIGSYPKQTRDWEGVLAAAEENAALLPDIQNETVALKQTLDKVKALKDRQESHRAAGQVTTQELKQTLKEGRDLAAKVRDAAKFKIGRRSERLVQFSVTPLRQRAKKVKQAPPEVHAPKPAA